MTRLVDDLKQVINFWGLGFLTTFSTWSEEGQRASLLLSFLRREVEAIVSAHVNPDGRAGRILSPLAGINREDLLLLKKLLEDQAEAVGWEWERTAHISRVLDAVVAELDRRGDAARD